MPRTETKYLRLVYPMTAVGMALTTEAIAMYEQQGFVHSDTPMADGSVLEFEFSRVHYSRKERREAARRGEKVPPPGWQVLSPKDPKEVTNGSPR